MKKVLVAIMIFSSALFVACDNFSASEESALTELALIHASSSPRLFVNDYFVESYDDDTFDLAFLALEQSFFETHLLYLHSFLNNVGGANLYKLANYEIQDRELFIALTVNWDTLFLDAEMECLLVFSVSRDYYQMFDRAFITGINEVHLD